MNSSFLSDILFIRCSITDKIGLFAANSASDGVSGKIEQLDSPSFVSDFIDNTSIGDLNPFILFNYTLFQDITDSQLILICPDLDILCSEATHN